MSVDELQAESAAAAAADESDAAAAGEGTEAEPQAVTSPQMAAPDPTMAYLLGQLIAAVGGVVTTRAKVMPLQPAEVENLANAAATVAAQYDVSINDPKIAAWASLAAVAGAVAAPRMETAAERRRAQAAAEAEAERANAERAAREGVGPDVPPAGPTVAPGGLPDDPRDLPPED